jgi:hypothetical protein
MNEYTIIQKLIEKVWKAPLCQNVLTKKVDLSLYKEFEKKVPDEYVYLEEVFPEDEIEEIWDNYKSYLQEHKIFPFIGTLGESVICIGYDEQNYGKIYYFDFDFGYFLLEENLDAFVKKLVNK